jgi:hypothetical protein
LAFLRLLLGGAVILGLVLPALVVVILGLHLDLLDRRPPPGASLDLGRQGM